MRDRRVPRVRGAAEARRVRSRVHRRSGLRRLRRRLAGAAFPPVLRGKHVTPDLSVEVGGLKLRGPVLAASGTFGYGTEVPLLDRRALAGMVSKGIFLKPRAGTAAPRIAETPSGMLNAIVEQGGMYFGNDPRAAAAVTEAVRSRTKLPVWVKLTPMVSDIGVIARAVEAAGADALSAVNTFVGMSMDLNAYQPRLSFRTGGLSGPAIRPLAVHLAHQAARAVDIPVVGVGGIMRADDALEFLVAGCRAVQVGTATFVNPNAIADVHDGISAFMARKGFASLDALPRYLPRD